MKFFHGTNSIAYRQILKDGYIEPLCKTNQMNLCCVTTTLQDDAIYLSTEKMIANFYTPKRKVFIENEPAYAITLEIDLPYNKEDFRADEDYADELLKYSLPDIYDRYIEPSDYEKYSPYYYGFGDIKKNDMDFRYLLSKNKELGYKILSDIDVDYSLDLGNVVYIKDIPINYIKSVTVRDIFSTDITEVTEEALNVAINKIDFTVDIDIFDEIKL